MKKLALNQLRVKAFIINNPGHLFGGSDTKAECDLPNTIPFCPASNQPTCGD